MAKRLAINYSSAKSICQVFKREGRKMKKTIKTRVIKKDANPTDAEAGHGLFFNSTGSNFTINNLISSQAGESSGNSTDRLAKLKDRLIQGRNNPVTNTERCDLPPYKRVHLESDSLQEGFSAESQQLQQIDRIIAQNHQILSAGGNTSNLNLPTQNQNNSSLYQNISKTDQQEQNGSTSNPLHQKLIKGMSNANQTQSQNFKPTTINLTTSSISGYPANTGTTLMNQSQQVLLNTGNNNQMALHTFQNQQVICQPQNFAMNCPQGENKIVYVMPAASQNRQIQYVSPIHINAGNIQQQPQQYQGQPIFIQAPQYVPMSNQQQPQVAQPQQVIYFVSPGNQPVAHPSNVIYTQSNFGLQQQQQQQPYYGQGVSFTTKTQITEQGGNNNGSQSVNIDTANSAKPSELNPFMKYSAQTVFATPSMEKKDDPQSLNYQTKKVVFGGNPSPLFSNFRQQVFNQ